MNYILMEYVDKSNYCASSKARDDVVTILKDRGAEFVPLFRAKSGHFRVFAQMIGAFLGLAKRVKKGDIIYIQYPYNPQRVNDVLIKRLNKLAKKNSAELCVIMHDINSFRYSCENEREEALKEECKLLSRANSLIVHNRRMKELLNKYGCSNDIMTELQLFDYIYDGLDATTEYRSESVKVIVAGNLAREKSGYLYNLPQINNISFELFGVNYSGSENTMINYHGAFPPDELIQFLKGSFGLVWDGNSAETCEGNYGLYLKYNNPHKFSLYVASGIPVIVWKQSALADFVESENIGVAIDSLQDLNKIPVTVSNDDYIVMKNNIERVKNEVRKGWFLKNALDKSELKINMEAF